MGRTLTLKGLGWVLPGSRGEGRALLDANTWQARTAPPNSDLDGFSAKPFLSSVKGYLDPASTYLLAASAMALKDGGRPEGGELDEGFGVASVTRYGATLSAHRFYRLFIEKGHRYASPLVFPHGYANTAGNLTAIEFGFGGPHLVLYGRQAVAEAWHFAAARLLAGEAADMIVAAYEAVQPPTVPDGTTVVNGAVAAWITAHEGNLDPSRLPDGSAPEGEDGTVTAMVALLRGLGQS